MKLKVYVASALFLAIFLAVSIFLISFLKTPVFTYLYFIFVFFWLVAISVSLKKVLPKEIKLSFLIVMILFVAVSLTFFGNNVKNYYDKNQEIMTSNLDLATQIENLTTTNNYYLSYIDFLNTEILKTKQASLNLQSQIDNFVVQQNTVEPPVTTPPQQVPPTQTIPREREEEDDD